MEIWSIAVGVLVLNLVRWLMRRDPAPIRGVYRLRGKFFYLKYVVFRIILKLRERQKKAVSSTGTNETAGYGVKLHDSLKDMEKPQLLPEPAQQPLAVDAVYFNGSNKDGYYFVAATSRRQNDRIQMILFVRVPGYGVLEPVFFPVTWADGVPGQFAAAGLKIEVVSAMKQWRITFDGKMRRCGTQELVHVKIDSTWDAKTPYFDFDTDMNPHAVADAMSREPWSREFFNRLQKYHQTHHEQFGVYNMSLEIEGRKTEEIQLAGVRDHSYGNIRRWRDLHRYALNYISLDDGSFIALGLIASPILMTRLLIGYTVDKNNKLESLRTIDWELYNDGDDVTRTSGEPPKQASYTFTTGSKRYDLKMKVIESPEFIMADQDKENAGARLIETLCEYEVNGVKGTGICEWCYAYDE